MSNRLPVLAAEIRRAHADVQEAAKTAAQRAIEAGHALIEAKKLVKHGEWLPWLHDHCAMAERTSQLYMKVARSGHSAETVGAIGLKGAEKYLKLHYGFHQPLHDGDDETRRDWWLFACFLVECRGYRAAEVSLHIDWLGRHDFKTVEEWLTEGPSWVATWGGRISITVEDFAVYRGNHDGKTADVLANLLQEKTATEQSTSGKRRRRKTATVADLGGADG